MKDVLKKYLWIFSIAAGILTVSLLLFPNKKNQLEFIEEEIKKVQTHQKILTEKDWEEVDKDTTK